MKEMKQLNEAIKWRTWEKRLLSKFSWSNIFQLLIQNLVCIYICMYC